MKLRVNEPQKPITHDNTIVRYEVDEKGIRHAVKDDLAAEINSYQPDFVPQSGETGTSILLEQDMNVRLDNLGKRLEWLEFQYPKNIEKNEKPLVKEPAKVADSDSGSFNSTSAKSDKSNLKEGE